MEDKALNQPETTIQGKNFYGSVKLNANVLTLDMTHFKKGSTFILQISNETLVKDSRRFLIFKKAEDLMDELLSNEDMEITD